MIKTPLDDTEQSDNLEDSDDEQCGWKCYKPDYLQRFRSLPWVVCFLAVGALFQGIVVNGLRHYIIPTIEHRFNLISTETGIIAGGYDFASLLFLIPVTFFGGRPKACKPKWIGFGLIIIGVGSFIFSLPYFLTPQRQIQSERSSVLCLKNSKNGKGLQECSRTREYHLSKYMWIFLIGNFLHGVGASPLFTLAVTYIDENVSRQKSSLFIGIFYSTACMGSAFGYILGGYLIQVHEDFLKIDVVQLGLTPESKTWVGAWWIGFTVCSFIFVIIAIPLLGLPPKLPGWKNIVASRVSEVVVKIDRTEAYEHVSDLPKAVCELLRNYSFLCINLAGCCEGIIISGCSSFMTKIVQTQFNMSSKATAYVMGIVTVPSAVMGTLVGGGLIKKFDLKFKGILKLSICTAFLAMFCASGFFLVCSNERFAGINVPYANESILSINNPCNIDCNCKWEDFHPICGTNNVIYFSPCYAGCQSVKTNAKDSKMLFYNCSCITHSTSYEHQATNQPCTYLCSGLPHFLILMYFTLFLTFIAIMPLLNATLRCVNQDQTSLAVGIQWMTVRLLGMVPGPILFGALLDEACIYWLQTCNDEEKGSCYMYDHNLISRFMIMLAYGWKALEIMFLSISLWFYNRSLRQMQVFAENIIN